MDENNESLLLKPEPKITKEIFKKPKYPEIPPGARFKEKFDTGIPVDSSDATTNEILDAITFHKGRIPYSTFMYLSLYGKNGYYSRGKVQIAAGKDFVTAPAEYPKEFGKMIGITTLGVWEAMGKPSTFQIIEMGAGEGILAHSLLTWTKELHPEFYASIQYTILEYGDLIDRQKGKLKDSDKVNFVKGSAYNIPFTNVEGVLLSNELPDAFPIERVAKIDGRLKQKYITVEGGKWTELWEDPSEEIQSFIERFKIDIPELVEIPVNLNAERFQHGLDSSLKRGAIATIDYGYKGEVRTKQSLRHFSKRYVDASSDKPLLYGPYMYPGEVDLTSDVDFSVLERIARDDDLTVAFSGTLADFYTNYLRIDTRSYNPLLSHYGDYLCHILTKELQLNASS